MKRRTERLNHLIRQEISDLLRRDVKDPRLGSLISVTRVVISPDLKLARIMVSVLGDEKQKKEMITGFKAASGFFRRELARRLEIRRIPELEFEADDSIEQGAGVLDLLNKIAARDRGESGR